MADKTILVVVDPTADSHPVVDRASVACESQLGIGRAVHLRL